MLTRQQLDDMVSECLQDQLVSSGDFHSDNPDMEAQMEALSEKLLMKAQEWIEAERFRAAFELVWACIWQLECDARFEYPASVVKSFLQSWTSEADDILVAAASGMRHAWTSSKWTKTA